MTGIPTKKKEPEHVQAHKIRRDLSWQAPREVHYPKTYLWYLIVLLGAVLLLAATFWAGDALLVSPYLAGAVVIVGAMALISRAMAKPEHAEVAITKNEIKIGKMTKDLDKFRAFSLDDFDNHRVIRFWPKKRLGLPTTVILEGDLNDAEIRAVLQGYLPEEEHELTWSDRLSHWIRF